MAVNFGRAIVGLGKFLAFVALSLSIYSVQIAWLSQFPDAGRIILSLGIFVYGIGQLVAAFVGAVD